MTGDLRDLISRKTDDSISKQAPSTKKHQLVEQISETTMVSFSPVAVALLGLASYPGVAAFAPVKSGGFGVSSSLKQVRIV
jgi:hypothetical protein